MSNALLVLNAGSSSIKFSVFQAGNLDPLFGGRVTGIGTAPHLVIRDASGATLDQQTPADAAGFDHAQALGLILEQIDRRLDGDRIVGAGHRVVHGGIAYATPVRIDPHVIEELDQLTPLAPLHQPHCLAAIRAVCRASPELPQVACFDTAFHRTQPEVAQWFGLPRRYTAEGVRRYGFHGLSYEFIAAALVACDPEAAAGRVVAAHLGNGASMCALLAGRSVATTMSFTPVDGLLMGTRVGALDPGAMLHLMTRYGLDAGALERLIYYESGLLGVSGISSDLQTLTSSDDPHAADAIDLFVYRLGRELGSLAAALGGLDALVFTGGIGENSTLIRARVCRDAAWLGVRMNPAANDAGAARISDDGSSVKVWVIPTNEELMIAKHTQRLLASRGTESL